jgi:hypothetical protein
VAATGPPIVVYSSTQGWTPSQMRATLQGFFLPNGIFIIISHFMGSLYTLKRAVHLGVHPATHRSGSAHWCKDWWSHLCTAVRAADSAGALGYRCAASGQQLSSALRSVS